MPALPGVPSLPSSGAPPSLRLPPWYAGGRRGDPTDPHMSVLTLSEITKSYGPLDLLRGVSFFVGPGRRAGLVGPNGAGKSTLLRIVLGEVEPDSGSMTLQPGAIVGMLAQEPCFGEETAVIGAAERPTPELQALWRDLTELEAAGLEAEADLHRHDELHHRFQALGGYECAHRARGILAGLGFPESTWSRSIDALSGGERTRLALAQLLVRQPDLLLLDEPTNHIDWETCEWLQGYLSDYPGAALVVSHDRFFLDRVVQEVIDLSEGRTRTYSGNYSAYRTKKEREIEQAQAAAGKRAEEIERQQAVIQRLRSHRKFDSMHARERVLERLESEQAAAPVPVQPRRSLRIHHRESARSGREVLVADRVTHGYGERKLFSGLNLVLERGERLAVVGPNGAGKTTLLRILAGELTPLQGAVRYGFRVQPAYFSQDQSDLEPAATVWETLWDTGAVTEQEGRQALHQFLFMGAALDRQVGDLSGGERTRLALCRALVTCPNLLLLDEPTNHLDLPAREAVERALCAYNGAVVVVSHDRYLLDAVATRVIEIREGKTLVVDGGYSRYRELVAPRRAPTPTPPARPGASRRRPAPPSRRLPRLEQEIAELEAQQRELERSLVSMDSWRPGAQTSKLTAEYEGLAERLAGLYREWEEVAAAVEAA